MIAGTAAQLLHIVLDTSAYAYMRGGDARVIDAVASAELVIAPSIVVGEISFAFENGAHRVCKQAALSSFLVRPFVSVHVVDVRVARRSGRLVSAHRERETPMPMNDIWSAAITLEVRAHLLTFNHDFNRVPALELTVWKPIAKSPLRAPPSRLRSMARSTDGTWNRLAHLREAAQSSCVPRMRRIALIGHPHVVVARGNNGDTVFFDDTDFEAYLALIRDLVRDGMCTLYAWCLMKNEVRLVVVPQRLGLAQVMQKLHGSHARRINRRRDRTGHLFEGRFRSLIIPEHTLAEAVRWVHLWPVRIGRVKRAETYPWSSHRAYVAKGDEWGDLVNAWGLLERYGQTLPAAQRAFSRFVEQGALERDEIGIDQVITGVAGDRKFAESVLAEAGVVWRGRRRPALLTLASRVSLLMNVHVDDLTSPARQQELVVARRLLATSAVRQAGRTVTEVADFLHRDKGQVSRLVQQGMAQMRSDAGFRALLESMRQRGTPQTPTVE